MIRRYFYRFSQSTITVIWWLLFGLMFIFAVTSPNIILGDNATFGTSTTMLTTSLVIVFTCGLVGCLPKYYYAVYGCMGLTLGFFLHAMLLCDAPDELATATASGVSGWLWNKCHVDLFYETFIDYSSHRDCHY